MYKEIKEIKRLKTDLMILEAISKIRTEYFGCDDVLKGFGEPRKYGVFLSVRRSLSVRRPARKTTGVFLKWLLEDLDVA